MLFWTRDNIVDGIGCIYSTYILIKNVRSQINYRRAHIARTLIPYYIVMNDIWVAHNIFSSQIDNINEKNNVPGFRSGDASVKSIMSL